MNPDLSKQIKLIRSLSGQENVYTIPKLYVRLTECHIRGLVLNQIIFYSDKSTRHKDGWFDKSYDEWEAQTLIKERTLRNIFNEFEESGWAEFKVMKVNGKVTLVCRPLLENILSDIESLLDRENPPPSTQQGPDPTPQGPPGDKNITLSSDSSAKFSDPPIRQNLPASYSAKFADSFLYTDKTTDKTTNYCKQDLNLASSSEQKSSSSFFNQEIEEEMLQYKLLSDSRTDEEFLEEVNHHIENNSYKNETLFKRQRLVIRLLRKLFEEKEVFKSYGFQSKNQNEADCKAQIEGEIKIRYRNYLSRFLNDRDVLKIASVRDKQPLSYSDWLKNELTITETDYLTLPFAKFAKKEISNCVEWIKKKLLRSNGMAGMAFA